MRILCVIAILISGSWVPLQGQSCSTCEDIQPRTISTDDGWTLHKDVDEVNVVFSASRKGKFVEDLTMNDIVVQDDHKPPAAVLEFSTQRDLPLRIGLVIDTSDSVQQRFSFEQDAASTFLKQVITPASDLGFVLGFSVHSVVTQTFTGDSHLLSLGLSRLPNGGGTALYDAVATACHMLAAHRDQRLVARIIVVLSDGEDNSSNIALNDAIRVAQQTEVTLYTISTDRDYFDTEGDKNLNKLAQETGGRALIPHSAKQLVQSFDRIEDELRTRYAVSYRPADFKPDGHYRRIEIKAKKLGKKLKVHARKGYYADLPTESTEHADFPSDSTEHQN